MHSIWHLLGKNSCSLSDIRGILPGILSGILPGMLSDILSGIIFDIYFDILSDIYFGILSDIYAGKLSDIYSGILSGIPSSGILSGILLGIYFGILSGILSGSCGPAVVTGLGRSPVEVQRCPLGSGGPQLRSSGSHWTREVAGGDQEEARRAILKSKNPHLAGGENQLLGCMMYFVFYLGKKNSGLCLMEMPTLVTYHILVSFSIFNPQISEF